MIEFYKKHVLPFRKRAEHAEAMVLIQSKLIAKLSAKVMQEGK